MAGFTPRHPPVGPFLGHTVAEFPMVGILMAAGTRAVFKPIWNDLGRVSGFVNRMTFRAGHRQVRARERITALLMLRDRKRRGLESGDGVTRLALAPVGGRGELTLVRIGVTVQAFRKSDLVSSRCAGRKVAFSARNGGMFSQKRIGRGHVRLCVK